MQLCAKRTEPKKTPEPLQRNGLSASYFTVNRTRIALNRPRIAPNRAKTAMKTHKVHQTVSKIEQKTDSFPAQQTPIFSQ